MSESTKIEWCDATINFWHGCTKVSAGCKNCYAERYDKRKLLSSETHWGKGKPRLDRTYSAGKSAQKLQRKALRTSTRIRVFANSLSDWLDPEVPADWQLTMMHTIMTTPNLDWILLTKRPQEWDTTIGTLTARAKLIESHQLHTFLENWLHGTPPDNVWIGTSVEDQPTADTRIPDLLEIHAPIHFLSCEPLLARVDLAEYLTEPLLPLIDWIIVGGESGAGARPFNIDWAHDILQECTHANYNTEEPHQEVAFFMKQIGGTRKPFPPIPPSLLIRDFPTQKQKGNNA